jgi:hypothetical protein
MGIRPLNVQSILGRMSSMVKTDLPHLQVRPPGRRSAGLARIARIAEGTGQTNPSGDWGESQILRPAGDAMAHALNQVVHRPTGTNSTCSGDLL